MIKSAVIYGKNGSGKLNFYRRINTSFLNESVKNSFFIFSNYIKKAINDLNINAKINILKADGGVMSLDKANTFVVETILSGPAASLMGSLALSEYKEDAILLDIGGTTTDIFFLAEGVPLFSPLGIEINEYKTLVRSIYSKSISLGGNTGFYLENNKLKIDHKKLNKPLSLGGKLVHL